MGSPVLAAAFAIRQVEPGHELGILAPVIRTAQLQKAAGIIQVLDHSGEGIHQRAEFDRHAERGVVATDSVELATRQTRGQLRVGGKIAGGAGTAETTAVILRKAVHVLAEQHPGVIEVGHQRPNTVLPRHVGMCTSKRHTAPPRLCTTPKPSRVWS